MWLPISHDRNALAQDIEAVRQRGQRRSRKPGVAL